MNLTDQMDYLRKPDTSTCPPQAWLAGQTALVTGASSGIGQQIAGMTLYPGFETGD